MNKEWLITDTHFDHENIGVFCDRPDGWMDKIIKNWQRIVKPEDVVVHLGDVQVGRGHNLKNLMASLPGTKILVIGNHDTKSPPWYMRNGFAFACDLIAYKGVTFSHHPLRSLIEGTDINVHGHVHNTAWNPTEDFQRLLAIEHVNYSPVDLWKWINMARSEEKWREYRRTWKIPVVEGRKHNSWSGMMAEILPCGCTNAQHMYADYDKQPWPCQILLDTTLEIK